MLIICVMLGMVTRVVAHPVLLASPEEGLVALCSNGQIIYISLETGQPVPPDTDEQHAPCPYAGLTANLTPFMPASNAFWGAGALKLGFLATEPFWIEEGGDAYLPRAPPGEV